MEEKEPFDRVHGERLSDAVVEQIAGRISSGGFSVGERLPSERELMEQFGVSRASVREALRTLEAQGTLDVRQGLGTFVVSRPGLESSNSVLVSWLRQNQHKLMEILEVREAIEAKAASLAALRRTEQDLERMEESLIEMNNCVGKGQFEEATMADRRFHRLLTEASGNGLLVALADNLGATLHELRHSTLSMPGRAEMAITEHWPIVEALRIRDPGLAQSAVLAHLGSAKKYIREFLGKFRAGEHDGTEDDPIGLS